MLLKCGTQANAVPTLLRACPTTPPVPPTDCGGCGTFPSIVYLTMTVPNNDYRTCFQFTECHGYNDQKCVRVFSSGERLAIPMSSDGFGYCSSSIFPVPAGWLYARIWNSANTDCSPYSDEFGDYNPCEDENYFQETAVTLTLMANSSGFRRLYLSFDGPPFYGFGFQHDFTAVAPFCGPSLQTVSTTMFVKAQDSYSCNAEYGPNVPVTFTLELPSVSTL
jgi:hypothetical protein